MKFNSKLIWLLVIVLLFVGCDYEPPPPSQSTDSGGSVESKVDMAIYTIQLEVESLDSYSTTQGSLGGSAIGYGSGFGYGSISGSVWQDGKGLTRGILISSEPAVEFSDIGDIVIVKTTDRKATMGVPGDVLTLYCTADYEPVCSKVINREMNCYELWEFDYCRLVKVEHP